MKNMSLDLQILEVKDVRFGETTFFCDGLLTVNKEELLEACSDRHLVNYRAEVVYPGESARIIPVKDVIEPRCKTDSGEFYPGILGGFEQVGEGKTTVLRGCNVVTAGQIVFYQEGLIDMSGPGADYCIFSKTINVVVMADPVDGLGHAEHETAVRMMGLKAAHYLAKAVKETPADKVEHYELPPVDPAKKLPRIAYVSMVLAQGLLHDNYVYGINASRLHTMFMSPMEYMDGAVVSGNCVTASCKTMTYDHCNNPAILELMKRHGKDLEFVGVITSPITASLGDKNRGVMGCMLTARQVGVDAMFIGYEGGGNPESDIMMLCAKAEKWGIKTVMMCHENAGWDGVNPGLAMVTPEADAVVAVGNNNERIILPPMDRIVGDLESIKLLAGAPASPLYPDGSILTTLSTIIASTSNIGILNLGCLTY